MIDGLQILFLVLAGIAGTVLAIVAGWAESNEPFDAKKAVSSLIRGIIAVLIYIVGTFVAVDAVNWFDYIVVAIWAAGFDAILKRGQGVVQKEQKE